jgi:branched-chain amino acid transport system substrate-binding protein
VRVGLGQPLYLGTLLFESDPIGVDVARSIRLAIDYLDGTFDGIPGQLLGHDVSVVAEDDGCSAVGGRTGAIRLLQEPALVAVIGTSCSSAAFGAADVTLEKDNVLLLSASNTAPGLTDSSTHERNYFRIAFNDIIQGSTVADFAFTRQQWATAISVHKEDDAYSTQLTEAFTQSFLLLGGTSLSDLGVSESLPPAAVQRAVAKAQPAFVFIAEFTPVCDEIAAAIRQAPSTRDIPIVVSEACQTPTFLKTLGADANGIYTSGPDFSTVRESEFYNTEYLPAYRRLTGGDPIGVFHPTAWDTAHRTGRSTRATLRSRFSASLRPSRRSRTAAEYRLAHTSGVVTQIHLWLGLIVIAINLIAGVWGLFVWRQRLPANRVYAQVLAASQTVIVGQAIIGLLLLSQNLRAPEQLHYVYGLLPAGMVIFAYSARRDDHLRNILIFSIAALLAAALSTRALTVSGLIG